jgi:hypothetical protein
MDALGEPGVWDGPFAEESTGPGRLAVESIEVCAVVYRSILKYISRGPIHSG